MTKKNLFLMAACLAGTLSLGSGCTTQLDEDAFRAGAIQLSINEVTTDELYPSAGDEIDWKMVFVPTPGNITVKTFWDTPLEIFGVELGVYDRFGIKINSVSRDTGSETATVTAFLPEPGLHYIKLESSAGGSIYSINVEFETDFDGFQAPDTAPTFDEYVDFEEVEAKNSKDSGKSKKDKGKKKADDDEDSAGGASAGGGGGGGGGGAALPSKADGGMAAPADDAPTVVKSGGGSSYSASDVKKLNNNAGAGSSTTGIKPICADIKGKYKKVNADIMSASSLAKGTQFKLNVGKRDGITEGSVGEIYVDGKILEGGRFKVDKILENSIVCTTNAPAKTVKSASGFVVKVPE